MNGCFLIRDSPYVFGRGGNKQPGTIFDSHNPPSILEQTNWPCDYFDFSKSELPLCAGRDYFNCGMVGRPDGEFLVVRRSENRAGMPYGMNMVMAFKLDGVTPKQAQMVNYPPYFKEEHFEDPRVVYHGGRTWISGTNFVWAPNYSGAHQMLIEVDDNWKTIRRHDPIFGGNGKHVYDNKRNEKNWIWFFKGDDAYLIYQSKPLVIARFDLNLQFQDWQQGVCLPWTYGEIRGGSPPVLVEDEYWVFFHSSVHWPPRNTRRYLMGAYAFNAEPPFHMTRITERPLLSGSPYDRYDHPKPIVVFPCGARLRYGHWLVTFGVNDLNCAYIRIPHDELLELCTRRLP